MKKIIFLIFTVVLSGNLRAQQYEWVSANPVGYSMNPSLVDQAVFAGENGIVFSSRMDSSRIIYGQDVLGSVVIEAKDGSGSLMWQCQLSDSVLVRYLTADSSNNLYVAGRFIGTLNINSADTLSPNFPGLNINDFILKISPSGILLWKKNLNADGGFRSLTAIACDHANNFWFSMNDFSNSVIFKTDGLGSLTDSLSQSNSIWVTSLSFDAFGALYICGATSLGTMTIGNMSVNVPEQYMMYVARYNSNFNADWIHLAHDITFQHPVVVSDNAGGAYLACNYFDSLSWGNLHFDQPQWGNDFFLVRIDSSGNFLWARSNPPSPGGITGRFTLASGRTLDCDDSGNAVILGTINGTLDWGNGVSEPGTLGFERLHIVTFSNINAALWQKTAQAQGNYPTDVSTNSNDEIFFTAGITGTGVFDTFVVNNGGGFATVVAKIIPTTVSVPEIARNESTVFPNPSTGFVYIPSEWESKTVNIYSLDGRLVQSINEVEGKILLDNFVSGTYILSAGNKFSRLTVINR